MINITIVAATLMLSTASAHAAPMDGRFSDAELVCFQNGRVIVALEFVTDLQVQEMPDGRRYVGRWARSAYATPEHFRIDVGNSTTCISLATERGFFFSSSRRQ
ncbi:hypothetical protein FHW79_005386 [Azospirillum sp. OGB3]|uniref:hypothetical protein n=1 Tax=Azospirillum sp. OGB3 TaxID=2587012 RepID=UPI0016067ED9|nr:hypothetical protein [Azospirillum sp. OGB3]MBB3267721.1 hypothetical protein [Azospirillum sp. OGB3]